MPDVAYDVYLSFSSDAHRWVQGELLPRLHAHQLLVCAGEQDFFPGTARVLEIERAIQDSRYTLLIISPAYLDDSWRRFESVLATTLTHGFEERRLIPLLRTPVALPPRLAALTPSNFVDPPDIVAEWQRLLDALGVPVAVQQLAALPEHRIPEVSPLPPGSRMPLHPNPLFTGRADDLQVLARLLRAGETAAIGPLAAATGLGGIGKTQLAVEFVHRYGRYFAGGVFWLSFADPSAVLAEIAACASSSQLIHAVDIGTLPLAEQARLVQEAWHLPIPRLLVFDNCEDEALLQQWRPRHGGCRVLITSRRASWTPTLGVQPLPLDVLRCEESVSLLRRYLVMLTVTDGELELIAAAVGDLPLALHLSGSFLARYGHTVTPSDYRVALGKSDALAHRALMGWKRDQKLNPTQHEEHVARTFALSYEQLDAENETDSLALQLLSRTAYFAPGEPIPHDLLVQTLGRIEESADMVLLAEDALHRLRDLGLLQVGANDALRIHRLLVIFVRAVSTDEKAQADVEQTLLDRANDLNNAGDPRPLLVLQVHLRTVTDTAYRHMNQRAVGLCITLGFHLEMIADYPTARLYYERALAISEQSLGAMHLDTARSLNHLGQLLYKMNDYSEAKLCYERALVVREQELGTEHPLVATSLNNLGVLLQARKEYAGARTYLERALAIREQALGSEHAHTAISLANFGKLLHEQGDLQGARSYYARALAIQEQVLGMEHPDTATSLNNLGGLLQDMGDLQGARSYYERALILQESLSGRAHPDIATSLNNLGLLHRAQGDFVGAKMYLERALAIVEQVLGLNHLTSQIIRDNLAALDAEIHSRTSLPED